jgi:hypothetical protein
MALPNTLLPARGAFITVVAKRMPPCNDGTNQRGLILATCCWLETIIGTNHRHHFHPQGGLSAVSLPGMPTLVPTRAYSAACEPRNSMDQDARLAWHSCRPIDDPILHGSRCASRLVREQKGVALLPISHYLGDHLGDYVMPVPAHGSPSAWGTKLAGRGQRRANQRPSTGPGRPERC